MFIETFLQSFVITFTMLFAVGPICLTVINTTIARGALAGLAAGTGVATADTVYIIVAGLAMDYASAALNSHYVPIFGVGSSLFLIFLSYRFWHTDVTKVKTAEIKTISHWRQFAILFAMTISGPTTILTYAAVFSNFINAQYNMQYVIIGGICGTFSFYLILVMLLVLLRHKMTIQFIAVINKLSSIIILIFALLILKQSILSLFVTQ